MTVLSYNRSNHNTLARKGATMADLEGIIRQHMERLEAKDVAGLIEDYDDRSSITAPQGEAKGVDAIRSFFEQAAGQTPPGTKFDLTELKKEGDDTVVIGWNLMMPGASDPALSGGDSFRFEGETIVEQKVWFGPRP